uniref:NADH-ubiquinone oxidoreductase chain 2 n=1 Tax=Hippodamia variegata TaxID=703264 RepID=A0A6C0UA55_9CUCU|nr:NADH dehydrogenase subunit 2 [Hippodamia variegata]QIB71477.1 NADH dehydrogenase subunit 2 [Hippodamia variegata]
MKIMKFMFVNIMILGSLISISAFSWINIWIGLEMNLLAFIPIMNYDHFKHTSEVTMKYFLVQVSASMFILFSFLYSFSFLNSIEPLNSLSYYIFNSAILMKMGAAPFHFWYLEVAEGLSWMSLLILMTWQKIAPMILIMYNFSMDLFFCMIILMSMIMSSIKSWNQSSLKKILALSSINHIGWMLSMMFLSQSLWILYFLIYTIISVNLIYILNKYKIFLIIELFKLINFNKYIKMFFFFNFMSLGGIPPFLGFFPKWIILNSLMENNMLVLSILMIFLTLIFLYTYMRLFIQSSIMKMSNKKIFKTPEFSLIYMINWMNMIGLIMFTIIFNMY